MPDSEPSVEEILTEVERRRAAQETLSEEQGSPSLSPIERRVVVGADRFIFWLARRWLLVFNLLAFLYVGLPFLAPILMHAGAEAPAMVIHTMYRPLCHQLPFRSFYLFGEQLAYTREELGIPEGPEALYYEHTMIGDSTLGFKIALCQRDVAIYGTLFLFGLLYGLTGRRLRPLPLWAYILFGIVPIGLDGGLQLLSHLIVYNFSSLDFPLIESTALRRVITGTLFGLATAWLAYPYVQETFEEILTTLERRFGWKR